MDVEHFLRKRTTFIRHFYEIATVPFIETKRRIEAGESPYKEPDSDDGEPAFLSEWGDAETAIDVLGRTCISMLSASLHLYFASWERELGLRCRDTYKAPFRNGFLRGYEACFASIGVDWSECPADLEILEQVVLTRNSDQHPKSIHTFSVRHSPDALTKYVSPVFARDEDVRAFKELDLELDSPFAPGVHVTQESLDEAIRQIDALGSWLDPVLHEIKWGEPRT